MEVIVRYGVVCSVVGGWRGVGDVRTKAFGLNDNVLVGGEVCVKFGVLFENVVM